MPQQQTWTHKRLRIPTPYGTVHEMVVPVPSHVQMPDGTWRPVAINRKFVEALGRNYVEKGIIQVSPEEVQRNLVRALGALPEQHRLQWLNTLKGAPAMGPHIPGSVTIEVDPTALGLHGGANPTVLSTGAPPQPFKTTLTPGRAQAIFRSITALLVDDALANIEDVAVQGRQKEVKRMAAVSDTGGNIMRRSRPVPPEKQWRPQSPYVGLAERKAAQYGVPTDLFVALVQVESNWNPKAKSSAGAIGLAQLMPGTAEGLGVDPYDPAENLDGGARYIQKQMERFDDWGVVLAAYNAGPGGVMKAIAKYNAKRRKQGQPPVTPQNVTFAEIEPFLPGETRRYVPKVLALAERYQPGISDRAAGMERAREMARTQLEQYGHIGPYNAAVVRARMATEGTAPPIQGRPIETDYWEYIKRGFGSSNPFTPETRAATVAATIDMHSPAQRARTLGGVQFGFEVEDLLSRDMRLQLFEALVRPTDNPLFNMAQLALTATRVGVPAKGAQAALRVAKAARAADVGLAVPWGQVLKGSAALRNSPIAPFVTGTQRIGPLQAALAGAVAAERNMMGLFDLGLAAGHVLTRPLTTGKFPTLDDYQAALMNMVPFVNVAAPGLGEAFSAAGIQGAIDWDAMPSYLQPFKGFLSSIAPTFERADPILMASLSPLAVSGIAASFRIRPDGQVEANIPTAGRKVTAQDRARAQEGEIIIHRLLRDEDVPDASFFDSVIPDVTGKVHHRATNNRDATILRADDVLVVRKTGLDVPFQVRYLPEGMDSVFENVTRTLQTNDGEAAIVLGDRDAVADLQRSRSSRQRAFVVEAVPRRFATTEGDEIAPIPVAYRVKKTANAKPEVYSIDEVLNNLTLLERAAKALGFETPGAFVEAVQSRVPGLREAETGTPAGGVRPAAALRGALDHVVFVDNVHYRGRKVVGDSPIAVALSEVMAAAGRNIDELAAGNDLVWNSLREQGVSAESIALVRPLLEQGIVTVLPDGSISVRAAVDETVLNPELIEAFEAGGFWVDVGDANVIARSGHATEGGGVRLPPEEAQHAGREAARKAKDPC